MPPFINRKRHESASPPPPPARKRQKNEASPQKPAPAKATRGSAQKKKSSVFDHVDKLKPKSSAAPVNGRLFATAKNDDTSAEGSDSSDEDSDEFEDVVADDPSNNKAEISEDDHDDWEDALQEDQVETAPEIHDAPTEALELTLTDNRQETSYVDLTGKKQGPSKKDRRIREIAHCLHLQYLLWHNQLRSHWLNDKEIQKIMIGHLEQSHKMKLQLDNWKRKMGLTEPEPRKGSAKSTPKSAKAKGKGKGKGKDRQAKEDPRSRRDWAEPAERLAAGQPDLSHGDPMLPLLNTLAAWWKQRFTITAPGLRKRGYKPMRTLKEELGLWRKGESDITYHGEKISSIKEFRSCAKRCEGSRDVGAQLFAALLRGLGIEARLVASLQPLGYGWTKAEEAEPKKMQPNGRSANKTSAKTDPQAKGTKSDSTPSGRSAEETIQLSDMSELSELGSLEDDSDASIVDITPKKRANMPYDNDMAFPTYWIESVSSVTHRVFPVDPFILRPAVATSAEHLASFESRGAKADKAKQVFAYIVAFSPDHTAKDVTTRYLKKHIWPGRTKGFRMPPMKHTVRDRYGKPVASYTVDWWQSIMRCYQRPTNKRTKADEIEEEAELRPVQPERKAEKQGDPDTLDGYKKSERFVLERHLRREEALLPGAKKVKTFQTGKGEKAKEEPVYLRKDVVICRTSESWHKEGRQIKVGEQPLKMVKVRAVTMTRKREIEEAERETGEKAMQGMYGRDQTEWIIPAPIKNGVIPKNAYGNMDAFVPQMIPKGAIHIPMRGTVRVCKKLEIDFAEAVTGFEFGNKMAVPVIEGVVVAEENHDLVIDAWNKMEDERKKREAVKQEQKILSTWRKFLMGLRVLERMKAEYEVNMDDNTKELNPFMNRKKQQQHSPAPAAADEQDDDDGGGGGFLAEDDAEQGGGFLPEGYDEEIPTNLSHRAAKPAHQEHALEIDHDSDTDARKGLSAKKGKAMSLAELAAQQAAAEEAESGNESETIPARIATDTGSKLASSKNNNTQSKKKATRGPSKPAAAKSTKSTKPAPIAKSSTRSKRQTASKAKPLPEAISDSDELSALSSGSSGEKSDAEESDDGGDSLSAQVPASAPAQAQAIPASKELQVRVPTRKPPTTPKKAQKETPRAKGTRTSARSAAKAGQEKIRSHYFRHESTMGDDDDEDEDVE